MRPGVVVLALLFMGLALSAALWLGDRGSSAEDVQETPVTSANRSNGPGPAISETGPHPRAVIDETEHNFGAMMVGEERKHVFVIRNEGEAPLVLKKGPATCRCTVGNLEDGAVPPGGSAEVALTWKPETRSFEFRESATILTNDPERQRIPLVLMGQVTDVVMVVPSEEWHVGTVAEHAPSTTRGSIVSMVLEDFEVQDIESTNPLVHAEAVPLDEARLSEFHSKSGYEVRATIESGMPIGRFRETLTVHILTPDGTPNKQSIFLTGQRAGPVRILPTPGVDWIAEALALSLGRFPAEEGRKAELWMLVSVPEGLEFEILGIEPEEDFVRLTVTEEDDAGTVGRRRFRLTFEVPPGGPVISRVRRESVRVKLLTNHPEMPEIEFKVEMVAT